MLVREDRHVCPWTQGVLFSKATLKFSFITWLAMLDRLSTMDRVSKWSIGVDDVCVLCRTSPESQSHIFFDCLFSSFIWKKLRNEILLIHTLLTGMLFKIIIIDKSLDAKHYFASDMQCSVQ